MASNLRFNVTANDDASGTFAAVAAAAKALDRQLAKLDRKITAAVDVKVPAGALAKVQALDTALDRIDGRTARANVKLSGASAADLASIEAASAALAGLNGRNANAKVNIDVDRGAADRLAQVSTRIQQISTVAGAAAAGVTKFRSAAKMLVDPGTIPIIQRASDAIRNKFHAAVEVAAVGVGKLSSALKGLDLGILGLAAIGKVSTIIAGVGGALADLSSIALLAPAAIAGVGVAFAAVKLATTGFSDALTGSAKKQAEAFAAMGPEAQKLVTALKSLGPAANEFRRAVQDTAVEGLAAQVKQLAGTYLPMLKSGLVDVASGLNAMATNAVKMAQATATFAAVRTIIDATARATSNMRDSVANAVSGFLTLGAAGASSLPGIGTAIDNATEKFRVWSMVVTQSGQFDAWVARAKTGFANLGTALGNIGSVAATVFRTLDQNGAGLLDTFAAATTSMRTFVESAQGSAALTSLAQMAAAAGNALSNVLGAALRALAPILVSLGPVVSAVATAFGDHMVKVINLVTPALQRFAQELAKHPDLIGDIAVKLHTAVTVFGPFVAVLGLAAAALQKMIIARVALTALTALGLAGTTAGAALMFLVSPLSALGQLMPTIAAALGRLGASLAILAGPIGWLIVAFAAVYASSSQFRDAMNQIAGTLGGIFVTIIKDAGQAIAATVAMIGDGISAIGAALSGLSSAATTSMSFWGPFGQVVSDVLSTIFGWLGKLPGVALAAFAAFVVFGKIAPIFALASTAVAGFAARMAAFSSSSAIATAAANATGAAAGRFATALSKAGSALPIIGVALIALGAAYDEFGSKAEENAQKVVNGSQTMAQAIAAEQAQVEHNTLFWLSATQQQNAYADAADAVRQKFQEQYNALQGMDKLQADVAIAQRELNDAVVKFGSDSPQAAAAASALAAANNNLTTAQKEAAEAAKTHEQRIAELADTMNDQIGAMVNYEQAVLRTAEAQKKANDTLAESGKNSTEYKKSVLDLVNAMNNQANAAREQGKAWGGAEGATKAYNTELLRAADLSTQAGRDAFVKLASSLGATELASLSAAANMSGLRTEILTLPDGRKVTVVVAADQGKLPDVQQSLQTIANTPYIGHVTIVSETENLRGDITQIVEFANGQRGTIQTFVDGSPAIATINGVKYQIDSTTGTLKVLSDVAPGEANFNGFKLKVDQSTGQMVLDLNSGPGTTKLMTFKDLVDGTSGTVTLNGNGAPVEAVINGTKYKIDATTGIMTIDGNPAPGEADRTGLKAVIDKTTGTITFLGRDGGVATLKEKLSQPSSSTHTIYVRQVSVGANVTASASGTVGAGGGVVGFAAGGIAGARPTRFDRGGVIRGYQPGRDTVPALLSRGEGVLVPELVRQLGARRILAANKEASGRRAGLNVGSIASVMDGSIPKSSGVSTVATIRPNVTALTASARGGSGGSGAGALLDGLNRLGATLRDELRDASDMAHGDAAMTSRNIRAIAEAVVVAMRADSGMKASSARSRAALGMHA